MFGHGEAVLLHRYVGLIRNAHGQSVKQFAEPVPIKGVGIAPGASSEPAQGVSYRVVSGMTIYAPSGTEIDAQDELTVRGKRYSVDGESSGEWINPFTGWSPGGAVALKRVTG